MRTIIASVAAVLATLCFTGTAPAQTTAMVPVFTPPAAQDINGVWWAPRYSAHIEPMGGGALPFTPEGLKRYQDNVAGLKNKTLVDAARHICVPDGVPRILTTPYPFEILQSKGQTSFLFEVNHVYRLVYMDTALPEPALLEALPFYSGHAVGHWDGDTLVVDSAGFKDTTFLDDSGVPHSDRMTTQERIRKLDGGKRLEDVVTITDPATFTRPWSARFVYDAHPDIHIQDFVCGEKHRDLRAVKGWH